MNRAHLPADVRSLRILVDVLTQRVREMEDWLAVNGIPDGISQWAIDMAGASSSHPMPSEKLTPRFVFDLAAFYQRHAALWGPDALEKARNGPWWIPPRHLAESQPEEPPAADSPSNDDGAAATAPPPPAASPSEAQAPPAAARRRAPSR